MNALCPVLLNNQTLQAPLSCFPRDRAMWINGEDTESGGRATIDRYSPAHGALVTRAPRGTAGDETVDDAIGLANATSYGLSASIWSRDVDTAVGVGRGVRAGTVWVNTFMDGTPELPFGGYGQSGLGHSAVADYTEEKSLTSTRVRARTGGFRGPEANQKIGSQCKASGTAPDRIRRERVRTGG